MASYRLGPFVGWIWNSGCVQVEDRLVEMYNEVCRREGWRGVQWGRVGGKYKIDVDVRRFIPYLDKVAARSSEVLVTIEVRLFYRGGHPQGMLKVVDIKLASGGGAAATAADNVAEGGKEEASLEAERSVTSTSLLQQQLHLLCELFEKIIHIGKQKYYKEWEEERFSLLDNSLAGCKNVDFDLICIWKLYDQWVMSGKSKILADVFKENGCSGCDAVRMLSKCATVRWKNWEIEIDSLKEVSAEEKRKIKNIFREAEWRGWGKGRVGKIMEYLARACERLVETFGKEVTDSYFLRWLWKNLIDENKEFPNASSSSGDSNWRKIVIDELNAYWRRMVCNASVFDIATTKIKEFINKFDSHSKIKLHGVARETLNYLFRDWVDVDMWKYCWKSDTHNENFAGKLSLSSSALYEKLIQCLGDAGCEAGKIALFNTVIYRMDKEGELDRLISEVLSGSGAAAVVLPVVHLTKSKGLFLDAKEHIEVFSEPSLKGKRYLLAAPTSSGKSYIGRRFLYTHLPQEKPLLTAGEDSQQVIVVYLVPLRALAAEIEQKFVEEIIERDAFVPKWVTTNNVIRATGDVYGEIKLRDKYILVCTYEKFINMLSFGKLGNRKIVAVVCDEIQLLGKFGRGANVEELLYLIKYDDRVKDANFLYLCVNIKISGLEKICKYIGKDTKLIIGGKEYRPVPIAEGYPKFIPTTSILECLDKAGVPIEELGKSLVFIENKKYGLSLASDEQLQSKISVLLSDVEIEELSRVSYILEKLGAHRSIYDTLKYGITCHSADLSPEVRRQVENAFRKCSGLKMLISTTTLAQGVNLPARTVIINLSHLPKKGCSWETPDEIELLNMMGRAGRLGLEKIAYVIFYGSVKEWAKVRSYVESFQGDELLSTFDELQKPEARERGEDVEIVGRFILNTAISEGDISVEELKERLLSFYWGKYGKNKGLINFLPKYVSTLVEWRFLKMENGRLYKTYDGEVASSLFLRLEDLVKIRDWADDSSSSEYDKLQLGVGTMDGNAKIKIEEYILEKLHEFIPEKWLSKDEKTLKNMKGEFLFQVKRWINEEDIDSAEELLLTENVRDTARQTLEAMAAFCWSRNKGDKEQKHYSYSKSGELGNLCWIMSRRVEFGAKEDLLPLLVLRIPCVGRKVGRELYNNSGINSVRKVKDEIDEILHLLRDKYDIPEEITKVVEEKYKNLLEEDFYNSELMSYKLNIPIEDVRLIIIGR